MNEHDVADTYRGFAEAETPGVSELYGEWARGVAADDEIAGLIAALPRPKQQPNLVFAAARFVGAPVAGWTQARAFLATHWTDIVPVILARATQTNEAGRCAVLLPVLSRLAGPLALIETGSSAGLCLPPDRYSYRYDTGETVVALDPPSGPSEVVLPCRIDAASVPPRIPEIVWRAGIDLNPLDPADADVRLWLETLIWPAPDAPLRVQRLRSAAAIAAADPPRVTQGDILEHLPQAIAAAPAGAHVVVFHTAVLMYLDPARRRAFADLLASYPEVTWISNESASVFPEHAHDVRADTRGRMVLAVNGRPVALTQPHGRDYGGLEGTPLADLRTGSA